MLLEVRGTTPGGLAVADIVTELQQDGAVSHFSVFRSWSSFGSFIQKLHVPASLTASPMSLCLRCGFHIKWNNAAEEEVTSITVSRRVPVTLSRTSQNIHLFVYPPIQSSIHPASGPWSRSST